MFAKGNGKDVLMSLYTLRLTNSENFFRLDPRLSRNNVRVPRRDNYQNRPVLSATIHPDIKRILVTISERTGMSVSQVTDEVLYTGLIEMQELPEHEE